MEILGGPGHWRDALEGDCRVPVFLFLSVLLLMMQLCAFIILSFPEWGCPILGVNLYNCEPNKTFSFKKLIASDIFLKYANLTNRLSQDLLLCYAFLQFVIRTRVP